VVEMNTFLALAVAIGVAVITGTALAGPDVTRFSSDRQVVVLVSGCDGLVAQGGVPLRYSDPWPAYSHKFVASIHREGWEKFLEGRAPHQFLTHSGVTGSGSDAAAHEFTIEGTLTYDSDWDPTSELSATGGNVVVRRDVHRGAA
jgi:hypothetical protein